MRRLIHDAMALNTGPLPPDLAGHHQTATDRFFTRSHAAPPVVALATWRLEIAGMVRSPQKLTLDTLRSRYPERTIDATLVCAGMRRNEFLAVGPLPGELPWGTEAISSGQWTGLSLRDVLHTAEVDSGARYVEFVGADQVERRGVTFGFSVSIDIEKAMSEDVLLAHSLNGSPLPVQHGYPLRALVPGWIGAKSVKWLGRITVTEAPSTSYFQTHAYRVLPKAITGNALDVSTGTPMSEVPLNSAILDPAPEAVLPAGDVVIRGWAMGSGGRALRSVELSVDGGVTWIIPSITALGGPWTWNLWEATVPLPPGTHQLLCRATDAKGTVQPETAAAAWNVKGYGNNAWHRITIRTTEGAPRQRDVPARGS